MGLASFHTFLHLIITTLFPLFLFIDEEIEDQKLSGVPQLPGYGLLGTAPQAKLTWAPPPVSPNNP